MKVVTTPMCKEVLQLAGLSDFIVDLNINSAGADIAVVLSETKTDIKSIKIKLNTYSQIYNSITKLANIFQTKIDQKIMGNLQDKIQYIHDLKKFNEKRKIKVMVYSNFLKDIVEDMGFTIVEENIGDDCINIIYPDYMEKKVDFIKGDNVISIPSHKHVPTDPLKRAELRYSILEKRLCMKP